MNTPTQKSREAAGVAEDKEARVSARTLGNQLVKGSQRIMLWMNMLSSILICILSAITVADVLRRAFFGKALVGAVEITEFFMAAIVFMAIPYTQVMNQHVKVEFLTSRLSQKGQKLAKVIMLLFGITFLGFVTWQGFLDALDAFQSGDYTFGPGNLRLFTWPARFMVPLGCFWFMVQLIIDILREADSLLDRRF